MVEQVASYFGGNLNARSVEGVLLNILKNAAADSDAEDSGKQIF